MCRSASEGGQRCAAHTRKKFDRAERRLNTAKSVGDTARVVAALAVWEQAAAEYASTDEGHQAMTDRSRRAQSSEPPNWDDVSMYQGLAARGEQIREANKEAATLIRAAEEAARTTVLPEVEQSSDFDPRRETITAIRFSCEVHDRPGQCDTECLELASNMNPSLGLDYDPTGTSYPAPQPWTAYHLDTTHRALHEVTYTPNELIDEARLSGGPFDHESGRCLECDGHYKHSTDCPAVAAPGTRAAAHLRA